MSTIIEAKNIGIHFTMTKPSRSIKSTLKNILKPEEKSLFWALRNVSFNVNKGEILGVVGANGSGKSTLLRLISGIYDPDEGELTVNGRPSALLSLGTGFRPELSGYENMILNGIMLGFSEEEILAKKEEILDFSELHKFIHQPIRGYSAGMRARLGFSIAAFLHREIMLIDEILGVGDKEFKAKSEAKMKELIEDHSKTVIIVNHDLDAIKQYATKVLWIHKSKFMMLDETDKVLEEYAKS